MRQTDCMHDTHRRGVPLVMIGTSERAVAEPLAARMRDEGAVVLIAEGDRACLRVATAVSPDVVLLDPRLSSRLVRLLHAHPALSRAQISRSPTLAVESSHLATSRLAAIAHRQTDHQ
jgi:hypothetical protein